MPHALRALWALRMFLRDEARCKDEVDRLADIGRTPRARSMRALKAAFSLAVRARRAAAGRALRLSLLITDRADRLAVAYDPRPLMAAMVVTPGLRFMPGLA